MPTVWPKDTMAAKVKFYGDPRGLHGVNEAWYAKNVVRAPIPWKMFYAKKPVSSIAIHGKCEAALVAALEEIWAHCGKSQATIHKYGLHEYGGSFCYRLIRGSSNVSNHSFAIAVDLAPSRNGLNARDTDGDGFSGAMPHFAVDAFKRQGARWGGDYHGRKDPMHFEFVSA